MQFLSTVLRKNELSVSTSYTKKIALFSFISVLIFSYFIQPKTTHAGLISLFTGVTADQVSAKIPESTPEITSQNMALLQAAVNIDPNPYKAENETLIAKGNALVAEIGPKGTVAEIEKEESTAISLYTVRDEDTLSEISDMFGVSVNTIIWANDLSRNAVLSEGQTLIILPISGVKYTVKRGDTVKSIIDKYSTLNKREMLNEFLKYNDLSISSKLSVGDVVIIPDAEPMVTPSAKINSRKSTANPVHDADGKFLPGYYIRPIDSDIGQKTQGLHGYNAVDIGAPVGTPIHAAASGKVIASISNNSWNGGYGNFVIISHSNGTQTLYAHTLKNFVSVGDTVEQGQMIAKVGLTGKTTGPHVHFEIRGAKNPF